ncbi:hypothetical protein PUR61_15220 [Streptomyces sp. BE20]|uniref:hypothetical protein n=1 Tax=unclassified Streptomyces TaxID=2593676 RepID=UPI002E79867B|nr:MULTISPECIES: hypothetical protein [unclassified Streptomyces]MED7948620.1 hypothetical protein [Streptomyces sp. BE303]MEE1823532.1 hypothetical protein [Streptomyces sp. BE20]
MRDSTRRTIRTTVQTCLGIAAALSLIVQTSGIPEATPGVGVGLAVAAGVTKVMSLPAVDKLLPRWLRAVPDPDDDALTRAVRE